MRPIRRAALLAETPNGVELDCGGGIVCRVSLLGDDLGRGPFLRDRKPRQPRSWMVIAPGEQDTPREGRNRLDDSTWGLPVIMREQGDHCCVRLDLVCAFRWTRSAWNGCYRMDASSSPTALACRTCSRTGARHSRITSRVIRRIATMASATGLGHSIFTDGGCARA